MLLAILISIGLTVISHALSGTGTGGNAGSTIFSSTLTGKVTVNAVVDAERRQLQAHAVGVPSGVNPQWEWYVASDASGADSHPIGSGDGAITAGFYPGCYVKAVVTDATGKYSGSIESAWTGPVTMAMTGDLSISHIAVGYGPGFRASGLPADGDGRAIAVEKRYEVSFDANGSNPMILEGSGADGWRIPASLQGSWIRLVITPSAEFKDHVHGSIASDWVQVA